MKNSRPAQVAIVWANPYNKNLGVAALAYSALSLLFDCYSENGIDAEFTFWGSSKIAPDVLKIGDKMIGFNNLYGMDFFTMKSRIKLMFFPKRFNREAIYNFDIIFDIAEGDSFTDIYGDERFNRILNSKRFFSKLNKPQVLLPQTIGPFKDVNHEKSAFETMSKLNLVISRDKQSFDYTAKHLPSDKIVEAIDVAFYMPFEKVNFNNNKINVGINVSGLLWNGGYTKDNQFNMLTNYQNLIKRSIAFFQEQQGVQIHLVPHVVPIDHPVEDDYVVCELLAKEYSGLVVSPRFETPIEAKGYIAGLDFFTGARMHACIAAFSTGVAVFPMAYSRKFNGLFADTLQYEWMGDCVNETEIIVLNKLVQAFNNRKALRQQIDLANQKIVALRLQQLKKRIGEIITKKN